VNLYSGHVEYRNDYSLHLALRPQPRPACTSHDSLGPQFVTGTKQPIADALRENGAVAGQIRSMLLSLWGHRYLIEHGYLDRRETASLYTAFLIPALAHARGGLGSTPSQGST
jgi:hypothetical protein